MGAGTFFSKVASVDPLAQAVHAPGANKYAQEQAQEANSTGAVGPYAGVTPTLAGANAGYAPGGPGSNSGYQPFTVHAPGGFFGTMQRAATLSGNVTPTVTSAGTAPTNPSLSTTQPGMANDYVAAAAGAPNRQAGMNPQQSSAALFRGQGSYGY